MRKANLERLVDETGVSGTGLIGELYIYDDGVCVMKWLTETSSVAVYANIADVITIHGHNGKTVLANMESIDIGDAPSWVFDPVGYLAGEYSV